MHVAPVTSKPQLINKCRYKCEHIQYEATLKNGCFLIKSEDERSETSASYYNQD